MSRPLPRVGRRPQGESRETGRAQEGVALTLPVELAVSISMGASVALASRSTLAQTRFLRLPALWALVALQLILVVPLSGYLLWRFPAWSLMYIAEPGSLPLPDAALVLGCPVVALATFTCTRKLLLGGRWPAALALLASGALLAGLTAHFGRAQLSVIGSVEAFRGGADAVRSVLTSPLPFVAAAAIAAIVIGWGATLWRVWLLSRGVAARPPGAETPTMLRAAAGAGAASGASGASGASRRGGTRPLKKGK